MRKPRIPKPNAKMSILLASVIGIIILFFALSSFTGPSTLDLYFEGGNTVKAQDSKTLIVEYRNNFGKDLKTLDVEVEPVHDVEDRINFPMGNTAHEEMIGKGQRRRFQFPMTFQGLRKGSTYAIEVKATTPEENVTKRISIEVKGGEQN